MSMQVYIPFEIFVILIFIAGLIAGAYFHSRIKGIAKSFTGAINQNPAQRNFPRSKEAPPKPKHPKR